MIFASDLDRTLIYSNRALIELGKPKDTILKPVEKKEGKWVSFMTEASYTSLREICRKSLFVPVTTRTTEQFERITIFQRELPLPYAITANGAVILRNGERVEEWSEWVAGKLKQESAGMAEMLLFLNNEKFTFTGKIKKAENFFFYLLLERPLTVLQKNGLTAAVASYGWRISLQGRKLYFLPKAINKGVALDFICNHEGVKAVAGSGDSILDWDFLSRCRYRFVPHHGQLAQENKMDDFCITKSKGILAGEEIVKFYLSL